MALVSQSVGSRDKSRKGNVGTEKKTFLKKLPGVLPPNTDNTVIDCEPLDRSCLSEGAGRDGD